MTRSFSHNSISICYACQIFVLRIAGLNIYLANKEIKFYRLEKKSQTVLLFHTNICHISSKLDYVSVVVNRIKPTVV